MNPEGRSKLQTYGFPIPGGETSLLADQIPTLNILKLYEGSTCGISIQTSARDITMQMGPNGYYGKFPSRHYIPKEQFQEELENVIEEATSMIPRSRQVIALAHSVHSSSAISGICARIQENASGYIACEIVQGQRHSDFDPEFAIYDDVKGGKRMAHNRRVQGIFCAPEWINPWLYHFMKELDDFGQGIVGLEFVFDTKLRSAICHDFYWTPEIKNEQLRRKFHLLR